MPCPKRVEPGTDTLKTFLRIHFYISFHLCVDLLRGFITKYYKEISLFHQCKAKSTHYEVRTQSYFYLALCLHYMFTIAPNKSLR